LPKEDTIAIFKKLEIGNQRLSSEEALYRPGGTNIRIGHSQGSGGGGVGGRSITIRSGRS